MREIFRPETFSDWMGCFVVASECKIRILNSDQIAEQIVFSAVES